ncbi:MAG TPA: hypothetical protein VGK74_03720 [Symbiobacteriaceae bacterium]|jgi:hypothetical protein
MGLINYDVTVTPDKPQVFLNVSATPTSLTVKVDHLGDFSLKVAPTAGTIAGGVVSGVIVGFFTGGPAGALLGGAGGAAALEGAGALLSTKMHDGVQEGVKGQGKTIDFGQPIGYSLPVGEVTVNVSLKTLALSTYNGMLMATGDVQVG